MCNLWQDLVTTGIQASVLDWFVLCSLRCQLYELFIHRKLPSHLTPVNTFLKVLWLKKVLIKSHWGREMSWQTCFNLPLCWVKMCSAGTQSTVRNSAYFWSDAMFREMLLGALQLTDTSPEPAWKRRAVVCVWKRLCCCKDTKRTKGVF